MNPLIFFFFFFLFFPLFCLSSTQYEKQQNKPCKPFMCGKLGEIHFPFYRDHPGLDCHGLYKVDCGNESRPLIELKNGGHWYEVEAISQANSITIINTHSNNQWKCEQHIESFALPSASPVSNLTNINASSTVLKCNRSESNVVLVPPDCKHTRCRDYDLFLCARSKPNNIIPTLLRHCSVFDLPRDHRFTFEVNVNPRCYGCLHHQEKCLPNAEKNEAICSNHRKKGVDRGVKVKLGAGLGIPLGIVIFFMIGFFVRRYCIQRRNKDLLTRNISDTNINADLDAETECVYYGIPLFSYKDLQEATNNFDTRKELGDGGFGTVYHGVLKDGREVAVKRLYEHNCRRVEQFMNEVEILTRLRHRNLVTLYGCTSHRSRDLLLVYEYVSNGTLADHLHNEEERCASSSPLDTSWPLRLSVAVETATALAYLHASGTVHRDVKSTNILLDGAFSVKVADFGLSRLFPSNVTHVSTAPQGTPGYVDPEYHQCYQLTAKSDVYSFGVVLVELLSSMTAVDITRRHHEINLSNLARAKIQSRAFEDLVDPRLGFGYDPRVTMAIVAVAELAFRCLEQDKEMRPTMDEVLTELKRIENGTDDAVTVMVDADEACLLKTRKENEEREDEHASPTTVTQNWPSNYSTTPNISIE